MGLALPLGPERHGEHADAAPVIVLLYRHTAQGRFAMRITAVRRLVSGVVLALVVGAIVLGPATEARAWDAVRVHGYDFENVVNASGGPVSGARLNVFASANGVTGCPDLLNTSNTMSWASVNSCVAGPYREILLGLGATLNNGFPASFNARVRILGAGPTFLSIATLRYRRSLDGIPDGPLTVLGWQVGSPPTLVNPATTPDGANPKTMMVRNLQFAESCCGPLDNPTIASTAALFAASADPVRPGPINGGIAPGASFTIPDVHSSITDPAPAGSTVLAKGTVEDANGNQIPFLVQFAVPPGGPGSSPLTLIMLALAMVTLGTLYVWRSRALTRTAA
jgi:hypothetical protein